MIPDILAIDAGGTTSTMPIPTRLVSDDLSVADDVPLSARTVADVMRAPVVTIQQDASIGHALCLMRRHGVRRLPVVDGAGRLQGMLTYGDVRRLKTLRMLQFDLHAIAEALFGLAVSEAMTRQPQWVTPATTILDAGRRMVDLRISGLPVVDASGMVIGIVTERDLFEALLSQAVAPDV